MSLIYNKAKEYIENTGCGTAWIESHNELAEIFEEFYNWIQTEVPPDMRNHPIYKQIWGSGWYAIYDEEYDGYFLSPIDFYDKHNYCPDGPEFIEITDEIEDFLDRYCDGDTNCILPPNFESTMESFVVYEGDGDPRKELEDFGFTILEEDNG